MWYYAKDGQQEGPVSQEDLQAIFQQQGLAAETMVWREGMAEWRPANQVPELCGGTPAGALAQAAPGLVYAQPPQPNSMALASMILGICGLLVAWILTAIPAVICGHIARRQIRESGGRQTGDGMAIAGLITGYLVIVLTVVMVAGLIIFFVFLASSVASGPPSAPAPVPPGPTAPAIP